MLRWRDELGDGRQAGGRLQDEVGEFGGNTVSLGRLRAAGERCIGGMRVNAICPAFRGNVAMNEKHGRSRAGKRLILVDDMSTWSLKGKSQSQGGMEGIND